jgi:hypothetical protein
VMTGTRRDVLGAAARQVQAPSIGRDRHRSHSIGSERPQDQNESLRLDVFKLDLPTASTNCLTYAS